MKNLLVILFAFLFIQSQAQQLPAISEKTKGLIKTQGFINYYWDDNQGKIFLEVDKLNQEFLYVNYLSAGLGSNDIGLDRGQLDQGRLVFFNKVGSKLMMVQPNQDYRAVSNNAAEVNSVKEAFATSILWGFTIIAADVDRYLVDATDFFLRDAHQVANRIQQMKQGSYKLDPSRSAIYLARTKNFPENTEFEATLTWTGTDAGNYLSSVVPSTEAFSLRTHHSFVKLPDNNYKPREFHPGSGYIPFSYFDYATPIDEPIIKRYIIRHRLEKKDKNAAVSEAVEPIIYYLDPGTPEPIRTALLEGASWWNQAFEAAGYKNGFQVKMLPEGADPLDIRYNIIQWVHRSTRGWSYGASVIDPRTGEILKGHVTLGSLRVRQDYMIAEGLLSPYSGNTVSPEMKEMALNRIRQLSAHEVGHTIGLVHNYAASVVDRSSVMDYPHPLVNLGENGKLSLKNAYSLGIGDWDKVAINYGYREFASANEEKAELSKILKDARSKGLQFITDADSRATGGAHPSAHLWDNGKNAVEEMNNILEIRKNALANFSDAAIKNGVPLSQLEDVLVPIFNLHRYQVEATSKLVGGLNYTYAVKGEGDSGLEILAANEQRNALDALLNTLHADELAVPEHILKLIPPRAFGYSSTRELFNKNTSPAFDALAASEASANFTLSFLFHPERAARLIEFHSRNNDNPGLDEVVQKVIDVTWKSDRQKGLQAEVQYTTEQLVLNHLINLASNTRSSERVKTIAIFELQQLKNWLETKHHQVKVDMYKAHLAYGLDKINRYFENPQEYKAKLGPELPPGAPIGCDF